VCIDAHGARVDCRGARDATPVARVRRRVDNTLTARSAAVTLVSSEESSVAAVRVAPMNPHALSTQVTARLSPQDMLVENGDGAGLAVRQPVNGGACDGRSSGVPVRRLPLRWRARDRPAHKKQRSGCALQHPDRRYTAPIAWAPSCESSTAASASAGANPDRDHGTKAVGDPALTLKSARSKPTPRFTPPSVMARGARWRRLLRHRPLRIRATGTLHDDSSSGDAGTREEVRAIGVDDSTCRLLPRRVFPYGGYDARFDRGREGSPSPDRSGIPKRARSASVPR